jgi:hypothetical protein
MNILNIIKNRWSARYFTNQQIIKSVIDAIIEALRWTPRRKTENMKSYPNPKYSLGIFCVLVVMVLYGCNYKDNHSVGGDPVGHPPTDIVLDIKPDNTVQVRWTDNSFGELKYVINVNIYSGMGYKLIDSDIDLPADTTSYDNPYYDNVSASYSVRVVMPNGEVFSSPTLSYNTLHAI